MGWFLITVFMLVLSECMGYTCENRRFPKGFLFGVSSSAYQIEGAWNVDGKGESIWDHFTHYQKYRIKDQSNGDVSSNSYYLYKRDVEMLRELGVNFYRFSLSWPRILPTGLANKINFRGVAYYNKLIDQLLANGIMPVVTLYHLDLPQRLQDMGGWVNPHISDWFGDYARVCFRLFGDRVKHWITINEPHELCYFGYETDMTPPAMNIQGIGDYVCAKNVLLSHATAYRIYDRDFRPYHRGVIGIILSAQWYQPASRSRDDIDAARDAFAFYVDLYAHPIYSATGDFPPLVKRRVAINSKKQGFQRSRLPQLSPNNVQFIKGTSDFFGLNHYFTEYAIRNASVLNRYPSPSFDDDCGILLNKPMMWRMSDRTMSAPWGFYKLLHDIRTKYNNPEIIILENGFADSGGLVDEDRAAYLRDYLCAMLAAMEEGCDVRGYAVWSLMDSFEWMSGYQLKMGLYQVNFSDPHRTRSPRLSAHVYRQIVRTRTLDYSYTPDRASLNNDNGDVNLIFV